MANSKKRRKILVFSVIGIALIALTAGAILRKREVVITVQTEKVARHNLTEIVVANGKIQPVVQVKISPEVSGEIIELPVKEGQLVNKGDLILKIKPDFYAAQRNQAEASYKSSLAGQATAEANLHKAEAEFRRNQGLFSQKLVSESIFDEIKAAYEVGQANCTSAMHQVEMAKASLDSADEQLAKTTIVSPLTGTVSKLNSQLGERVLGTVQNVGTDVMTISDLNEMEARVDIGEIDVVLIAVNQNVRLEVDAFKDRKFTGNVSEIANSSGAAGLGALGSAGSSSSSSQEATKFGVKIRIKEKEAFRPGMSVTAEIETRYRTNALTVPIASVTTRLPNDKSKKPDAKGELTVNASTNATAANTNSSTSKTNALAADNNGTNSNKGDKKSKEAAKPIEVVFVADGDRAKMVPVKIGISDDSYWEIVEGLKEGDEVVSGGYRAIGRDLEDGKKIKKGVPEMAKDDKQEKAN
jgi:HlyD family secretion protein